MVSVQDYVSFKPGTHCVYAWKSSGGRRLIYCRIESFEGTTVTVKLPMRNQPGHILLVVPLDRARFQTLPNRLVNRAKEAYQLSSIKDLPAVVKRAITSGDVPIPTALAASSAIGVYGGAELLARYQIITLGYKGGAPLGVLGLAALPGIAMSGYALQKVAKLENDPVTAMITKLGLAIGNVAGLAAAYTAVSRSGSVAGLSGRGIVTGLAALGGRRGTTMGLVACSGLFAVVCMAISGAVWGITRRLRRNGLDNEYKKFVDRWRSSGYKGPIEGTKVELH
ncbi:hypothetical protein VP1G_02346 [Cytospora mali]|uniref:Uncharacterized protein n=1 Tax=Cytospora mali TaxID=578113 RepID=A0A194UTP9_CYTMA|nr:hypothetical protein VP1G_02346 [Valsa mali var. pyri (nom. inval.)]